VRIRSSTPDFANIKQSPDNVPEAAAYAKARRREVRPGSGTRSEDVDVDFADDRWPLFGSSSGVTSDAKPPVAKFSVVKLEGCCVATGGSGEGELGGELCTEVHEDDKGES